MMAAGFILVAGVAAALAEPEGQSVNFSCRMNKPTGEQVLLSGSIDQGGIHSNIRELFDLPEGATLKGGLALSVEGHRHEYKWSADTPRGVLELTMSEYSRQNAAAIQAVVRRSDGRHTGYTFVGAGVCTTQRNVPQRGVQ
jgi:hypothetical protein